MMDFNFTKEQDMIRKSIQEFMKKRCTREYVRDCWDNETYPIEAYQDLAELGFLGLPYPKEYGGEGGDAMDMAIVIEELAYGFHDLANAYLTSIITSGRAIMAFGSEEQKRFYIPRISNGEIKFCYAMTEPDAGSDALSITTSAVQDGDSYVINGSKTFITAAQVADYIFLVTRTKSEKDKNKGITVFIVDAKTSGVKINKIKKLSGKAVATCEVFLDNVRVPKENMVGPIHEAWPLLSKSLEEERYIAAIRCVGLAKAVLNDSIKYAKNRKQFGQPISKFQLIKEKLVNMNIEIEASRLLAYEAAWLSSQGLPSGKEASMAKVMATETLMRCALEGMQIMGGYSLSIENDMHRYFVDAKQSEISAGTSEIHRLIIANRMGL